MFLPCKRLSLIRVVALMLACCATPAVARADVVTINFTALIGSTNNIDTDNLFSQGAGANLQGQAVSGLVTIDTANLTQDCLSSTCIGATYDDQTGGAITVSYTIRGVTQTVISAAPFWGMSGGQVGLESRTNGGWNYLSVTARSSGGALEESLGALFNSATSLSVFGGQTAMTANANDAIDSLSAIGNGGGLVQGGITLKTSDGMENLVATISPFELSSATAAIPEPATLALLGSVIAGLGFCRGKARAPRPRKRD